MPDYRKLRSLFCMLALALGLAACGGGGGPVSMTDPVVEQKAAIREAIDKARAAVDALGEAPTEAALTAAGEAVEAARMAVMDADALSMDETDDYGITIALLGDDLAQVMMRTAISTAIGNARAAVGALSEMPTEAALTAAGEAVEAARAAVMDADALSTDETAGYDRTVADLEYDLAQARIQIAAARAAEAAGMRAAFDGPGIDAIRATVMHGAAPVMTGTVLDTPPVPVKGLVTAGSPATVGAWTGGVWTASDEAEDIRDRIVLHTDIAEPGTRPFSGEGGKYDDTNGLDEEGNLPIVDGIDATLIASAEFPTAAGIKEHPGGPGGVQFSGMFDGAEGAYACMPVQGSPCTSSIRHGGGITLKGGEAGWTFLPAEGATVPEPDAAYRYFGWWLREAGDDRFIGTFHAGVGNADNEFASLAALQGPARYRGPAAGMVVIGAEDGSALRAEAFTAQTVLTADFGDDVDPGTVEGVVEEFLVDGESMAWSVALRPAVIYTDGAIEADNVNTALTIWTIDGMEGGAHARTWQGQFHEAAPDHVPTAATGSFEAAYGNAHRMIGAFGTNRQP